MKKMIASIVCILAVLWISEPMELAGEAKTVQCIQIEEVIRQQDKLQAPAPITKPEFIAYEDIPLNEQEQIHMQRICEELSVSYEFCLAIMESESTFRADAVGDGGESIGYFQINRVNWERMATDYGLDVNDPMDNIECGVRIIWELFQKYNDPYLVIMCYKCGESRGMDLYEQGIYETHQFNCHELCERAAELERSHGK